VLALPRTDAELRELLLGRIKAVHEQIAKSCEKVQRDPSSVHLVSVTKSVSTRVISIVQELGETRLGENRPQTLWAKAEALPNSEWHFIGHLQRNKVDRTIPLVSLFHSVDSLRLLQAIDDFAMKAGLRPRLFLEFNCSREEAKGGFAPEGLLQLATEISKFASVQIVGLMTMAAYSADPESARTPFRELRALRDQLQQLTGLVLPELSMGMSHDYPIAIEEGATYLRVGSTLFEGLEEE
jgi:PLP dependent protein